MLALWSQVWVEWVLIQAVLLYTLHKIYSTVNYLKQVLAMMWFVVATSMYLGLWQLELFACFLFLGEFTILIFFYCLFLHLRASTSQGFNTTSYGSFIIVSSISCLVIIAWGWKWGFLADTASDVSILYIDVYRRISDFVLNDVVALYYFFIKANPSIHLIIGLTLFLLTLCLFLVVSLYAGLNIARRNAYKNIGFKLVTAKGYYEQSAVFSQKYFSQKPRLSSADKSNFSNNNETRR